MFSVAVINLKNLIKKVILSIFIISLLICVVKFNNYKRIEFNSHLKLISSNLSAFQKKSSNQYNEVLNSELGVFLGIDNSEKLLELYNNENEEELRFNETNVAMKKDNDDLNSETENKLKENESGNDKITKNNTIERNNLNKNIENAKENISSENDKFEDEKENELKNEEDKDLDLAKIHNTEIIEEKNKKEVFTNNYGSVKIKNESKYTLTPDMIEPTVDFNNKKDIIIFHTHTCESYTQTPDRQYIPTSNYRTTDQKNSVVSVGDVLTELLQEKGYNVRHNKTYHDYPSYTGSYNRSYKTVKSMLPDGDWTEFVIDLHRDAIGNGSDYGPRVKIDDEIVAQLMFVIGTNGGGLEHPNWLNNFKLAIKIQEKANEMYPGLFKPIILRNSRYNQNLAAGACIIEVGATRKYYRRV